MEVTLEATNVQNHGANVLVRSPSVLTSPVCTKPPVYRDITAPRKRPAGDSGRCAKQSAKRTYGKKRRNVGKKKEDSGTKPPVSTKKVKRIKSVPVKQLRACSQGYRLMDLSVLQNVFTALKCPQCEEQGTLILEEVHEKQKGLASNLVLCCHECNYKNDFKTC